MLDPSDVVVGLLTENTPRMLAQAVRLLRSIRWFGGELAKARIVVCGVGELEANARATIESLGAEVRVVGRFHPANPTANRHSLIAALLDEPERVMFLLDCDTIVVRDPLPDLNGIAFEAKIAPTPTVSDEVFERLFAHFNLPKPARTHVARFSQTLMVPYFNAGVFAIPIALARTLAPSWRTFNQILADNPDLAAPCQRHMHQASLTLALIETRIPYAELPETLNYQVNAQQLEPPPGFAEADPAIIHYHHLVDDDGLLLPVPYPRAQERIELFHARLRAEGLVQEHRATPTSDSRPIVVLGMHRSGTSLLTEVIIALGSYAGQDHELQAPDLFNPTGYWEHREVVAIDVAILDALEASWNENIANTDVASLTDSQREEFRVRMRGVIASLQGHGSFVLKDPRMALLFPLWREVLGEPVCVIAWREPLTVARSLATRDKKPILIALATWEHYTRTLLRSTEGLPRILVNYEELLSEPQRVINELHDGLTRAGVPDLRVPGPERIRQTVNTDFNRSSRSALTDESWLDGDQRALRDDLRSGAALQRPVAPTAAHTRELLSLFKVVEREQIALREDVAELDEIVRAMFESRTWKLGERLLSLRRVLGRGSAVTSFDRWQESKRRRRERAQ